MAAEPASEMAARTCAVHDEQNAGPRMVKVSAAGAKFLKTLPSDGAWKATWERANVLDALERRGLIQTKGYLARDARLTDAGRKHLGYV